MFGKMYSSDPCGDGPKVDAFKEELDLLFEGVTGAKTYKQVRLDALKPSCPCKDLQQAVRTNAWRGVGQRLTKITGVSPTSLHYFDVTCKPGPDGEPKTKRHPFNLISTMIEKINARDECFLSSSAHHQNRG